MREIQPGDNMKRSTSRTARRILTALMSIFLSLPVMANDIEKSRARVEELFLWKVSDALGLDTKQELEFSKIMKKLRSDKIKLDGQMDDVLKKMEMQKEDKAQTALLEEYKGYLKEYGTFQMREVEQLEKLLGAPKVAKYLALKDRLITRLKGALAESGKTAESRIKGKEPRIVHEE